MTLKDLATELHTNTQSIRAWLKESNCSLSLFADHDGNINSDGEIVIREEHLAHTHPEISKRFNNMTTVLMELRKTINEREALIRILTKTRCLHDADELMAHDGAVLIEYNQAYLPKEEEWAFVCSIDRDKARLVTKQQPEHITEYAMESYGKTWRCWTGKPTDVQKFRSWRE